MGTSLPPMSSTGPLRPNVTPETEPVWVTPSESVQETCLPISPLAPNAIWAENSAAVWSATSCIFSSAVNWADWARNWLESVGFIGSWYRICATSNCRNMSLSALLDFVGSVPDVPNIPVDTASVAGIDISPSSHGHVEAGCPARGDRLGRPGPGRSRTAVPVRGGGAVRGGVLIGTRPCVLVPVATAAAGELLVPVLLR